MTVSFEMQKFFEMRRTVFHISQKQSVTPKIEPTAIYGQSFCGIHEVQNENRFFHVLLHFRITSLDTNIGISETVTMSQLTLPLSTVYIFPFLHCNDLITGYRSSFLLILSPIIYIAVKLISVSDFKRYH